MHEHEVMVLFLGLPVLVFIIIYRASIKRLPAYPWLIASFVALMVAWLATVGEHFIFPVALNVLEHGGYLANGILLFIWCWKGVTGGRSHESSQHV